MRFVSFLAGAALASVLSAAGPAFAQPYANPHGPDYARYPRQGGGAELQRDMARIDQIIRAVENDRRDDGGYRARAIRDLTLAREELRRAIDWDRNHGSTTLP